MKKMAGILAGVFCLTAFSGCGLLDFLNKEEKSYKDKVAEKLSLDFSDATLVEEWDTHGGFHGDGVAFLKLTVADGFESKLSASWKAFPLTEGSEVYQYYYEWGGTFEHPDVSGVKVIPEIENGYWWYEAESAQNWNFAALDIDTDTFYYYEFDS